MGRCIKYSATGPLQSLGMGSDPLLDSTGHTQVCHKPTQEKQGQKQTELPLESKLPKGTSSAVLREEETSDLNRETAF